MTPSRKHLPLSALAFLLPCALAPLPAAQLSYHSANPSPGPDDIANFIGAASDRDNIGGDGYYDGDANDGHTYLAGVDRPHQGQTFTTGANPDGYRVNAVWLRHVRYTSNTSLTWWSTPDPAAFTVRITRPSAVGGSAFALATETCTTTGAESGAPNALTPFSPPVNSADGTGVWLRFSFATPVALSPNTSYGLDVTSNSREYFFETHGIRDAAVGGNPYADGSAYTGSSIGRADDTLIPLAGDRVFMVEFARPATTPAAKPGVGVATLEVARSADEVWLRWPSITGAIRQIVIYRHDRAVAVDRVAVAALLTPQVSYLDKTPDADTTYWYWVVVTRPDGKVETFGPTATPTEKIWTP